MGRVHLLNLDRRPDRLASFWQRWRAGPGSVWPFDAPRRTAAIDGDRVPPPDCWTQQPGAWGCLRSHLRLYEDALSAGESLFIFEDDCVFAEDFSQRLLPFLQAVPDDWDMIYLGGLHRAPASHPPVHWDGPLYLGRAITTTYAYGVSARFLGALYRALNGAEPHHIDQMIARLMMGHTWRVYCPLPWLVGMDAGPSDICGRYYQKPHFWEYTPAAPREPIFLEQLLSRVELRDGTWYDCPLTPRPPVITSTIPGWFTPECGAVYRRICQEQARGSPGHSCVLVEVGSWRGRSLSYLADLIQMGDVRATAVDTWKGNSDPKDPTHGKDVHADFQANMARLGIGDLVTTRRLPSTTAARLFAPASCDVVMIDADHSEESVRADLEAWWPKVKVGGVLMGHDYGPACACPGVVKAVDDFARERGLVIVAEADLWIIHKREGNHAAEEGDREEDDFQEHLGNGPVRPSAKAGGGGLAEPGAQERREDPEAAQEVRSA